MTLLVNPTSKFAVQTTLGGQMLGAAIFLPADTIKSFVTDGLGDIEYSLKVVPEGILIEIGRDQP